MNRTALAQSRVYQDAANSFGPEEQQARLNFADMGRIGFLDMMATHQLAANDVRRDAQTAIGAARQLEYVMTSTFEEPKPDLPMANGDIIDINREVPAGAKTFSYYIWSGGAMARFMSSWSSPNNMNAWLSQVEVTGRTQFLGGGYLYSMVDLIHAGYMGTPLDRRLAKEDERAHARLKNDTGLWGNEALGLKGLINYPNINRARAAFNTGATSRTWAAKTAAEIMIDIGVLVNAAGEASEGRYQATNVWLPREQFNLISGMLLTTTIAKTVLSWAQETYPGVKFGILDSLDAAKSVDQWGQQHLSVDAAISLVRNPELVALVDPAGYTTEALQMEDLNLKVPSWSITGGVMLKAPYTVTRIDGI